VIIIKKIFPLKIICILTITTFLFVGCSNGNKQAKNLKEVSKATMSKNAKSITDNDLLDSQKQDSSTQLDSIDDQIYQLSTDEIDYLLNDTRDFDK